ncbi:MAG: hypothetical protein KGM91_08950 [Burkholderiales bacterium]|nr:hypothetical protein [Burkholderiales bacterium]
MRTNAARPAPVLVAALRLGFLLAVAALLVTGVIGGLLRAGVAIPVPRASAWPGRAVLGHAFLMICGFLGTVIGIERAVAVRRRVAFAAPLLSALAGLAMLAGDGTAAGWLAVAAAIVFIAVNGVVVERQFAAHTLLLLAGATVWLVGNVLNALGSQTAAVVPWWLAFLVLTIAAERLEMTRLMRRRRGAAAALYVLLAFLVLGSVLFTLAPAAGGVVYGLALVGLAAWLARYDIARRTLAARGLSRYMAVCLLSGYCWLAVSGLAWIGAARGYAVRDVALHALALGFVFSMMLAHAPVILPALTRVKLRFGAFFYVPLALLHASLVVRLLFGSFDFALLGAGAAGNAIAIALFAATLAGSALAWRLGGATRA